MAGLGLAYPHKCDSGIGSWHGISNSNVDPAGSASNDGTLFNAAPDIILEPRVSRKSTPVQSWVTKTKRVAKIDAMPALMTTQHVKRRRPQPRREKKRPSNLTDAVSGVFR